MTSKPPIDAELWKAFSLFIRLRDADQYGFCKCVSCGCRIHYKEAHAGHLISGRSWSIRYDIDAVFEQCPECNVELCGNVKEYERRLRIKIGDERVDAVFARAHQTAKRPSLAEIEALTLQYREKVSQLKENLQWM